MISISRKRIIGFVILVLSGCLISCNETSQQEKHSLMLDEALLQKLNQAAATMGQYQYSETVALLEPLHQKHPKHSQITLDLAIAVLNRQQDGDVDRAIQLTENVSNIEPENIQAKYIRGLLMLYQGKAEQAVLNLTVVVGKLSDDAYAHYFLAQALDQSRSYVDAFQHYTKAIELMPELRSALYSGAMAARRLKDKETARHYLSLYQKLENNPRAKLAEFKYTRMGPLAEILPQNLNSQIQRLPQPQGDVWASKVLTIDTEASSFSVIQTYEMNGSALLISSISKPNSVDLASNQSVSYQISEQKFEQVDHVYPNALISAWGDVDNDGLFDSVQCDHQGVNLLLQGTDKPFTSTVLLRTQQQNVRCVSLKLIDADHDGDLDVYVAFSDGKDALFSNNGDLTFRDLSSLWTFEPISSTEQVLPVDWDHDRDLDILLLKASGHIQILTNALFWQYHLESLDLHNDSRIVKLIIVDSDADGQWELLSYDQNQLLKLWKKDHSEHWNAQILMKDLGTVNSLIAQDITGNGELEIIVAGTQGLNWFSLNETPLNPAKSHWLTHSAVAKASLMASNNAKGPTLVTLQTDNKGQNQFQIYFPSVGLYQFANIYLSGKESQSASMRSNRQAIGVEARARLAGTWQIIQPLTSSSDQGQNITPMMFSTLGKPSLDYLELRWPDGVFQTEMKVSARPQLIEETQRQLSSCPVFFVKTDQGYQFVSDLLGVGGMGFLESPGKFIPPRPWEYFLIPQDLIKSDSSKVTIQISEPMEENTYLDSVQLHRYHLPPQWKMVLDERMGVSDPLPTGKAIYYQHEIKPELILNREQQEVNQHLSQTDHQPAPMGKLHAQYIGLLETPQVLTLYFNQDDLTQFQTKPLGLMMDAWLEYPYSQTVFAAWQAGIQYQALSFELRVNGQWQPWRREMGYPAGMTRRSYYPLDKLPAHTDALRLSSNLELYIDALHLIVEENAPMVQVETAQLAQAELAKIGFPKRLKTAFNRPEYVFDEREPFSDMKNLRGNYTRFGRIDDLVQGEDDALAIFGSGESIGLEFHFNHPPTKSLEMNDGDSTYYVLEVRGYAKDMDLYTEHGGTVTPLPQKFRQDAKVHSRAQALNAYFNTRYQDHW